VEFEFCTTSIEARLGNELLFSAMKKESWFMI
jgi:hypothetical protein